MRQVVPLEKKNIPDMTVLWLVWRLFKKYIYKINYNNHKIAVRYDIVRVGKINDDGFYNKKGVRFFLNKENKINEKTNVRRYKHR